MNGSLFWMLKTLTHIFKSCTPCIKLGGEAERLRAAHLNHNPDYPQVSTKESSRKCNSILVIPFSKHNSIVFFPFILYNRKFIVGDNVAILCVRVVYARICNINDHVIKWNLADQKLK